MEAEHVKRVRALLPGQEEPTQHTIVSVPAEPPKPLVPTLQEFLAVYLDAKRLDAKPSTIITIEGDFRTHIVPKLGHVRLDEVTYAVIEGPHAGWGSNTIVGLFATTVLALIALLVYEPRRHDPLIDVRFFRSAPFSSATLIAVCSFSAFSGFLFLNALYLQEVRGLSAFHTGLCTLPLALATMLCSPLSGRLVGTHGTLPSLLVSGSATIVSALIMTQLTATTPLPILLFNYALFGVGFGMVNAPITNTAVSGMPKAQAGLAAAVASTSRQIGASLGVAVAGTILGTHMHSGFAEASHPFWWLVSGGGVTVVLLACLSNTRWARDTTRHAAHLLEEAPTGATV